MRIRVTLEYDGTEFAGWQRQASGTRTVQAAVEEALRGIFDREIPVLAASRTDAGVHAAGQVAAFCLPRAFPAAALVRALNVALPADVAVCNAELVPEAFHPIRDALQKHYRYAIWNARQPSPLRARRSAFVPAPLDRDAMREAASQLVGRHDFASLQSGAAEWREGREGCERSTVRTIFACEVSGEPGDELAIDVQGDGFLRGMVRTLAGTLVEVGQGRRLPREMAGLIAARDRACAGRAAPAAGLTLLSVSYPEVGNASSDGPLIEREG